MTDDIGTKAISDFEIKDADRGEVTAVVSVFNIVDRDGDVVLPGAIKDGTVVKLSAYGHDVVTEGKAPVGRGVIRTDETRAVLHAKYFMSTDRGRDAFATVKELGADNEWSIGWPNRTLKTAKMTDEWRGMGAKRVIAAMDVLESSPVFIGANQFTRTVATKEMGEGMMMREPMHPVGSRVRSLVDHMPGMTGMEGVITEAHAGDPPYYAIQFDGESAPHKWLNEDEVAAVDMAQMMAEKARKDEIIAAVTKSLMDAKAAADAAAEQKRMEQEQEQERAAIAIKAAADAALAAERSRITVIATREFERFQRNMRMAG